MSILRGIGSFAAFVIAALPLSSLASSQSAAPADKPEMTAQGYLAAAATYSDNTEFTKQIERMVEGMRKAGLPEGQAKTN